MDNTKRLSETNCGETVRVISIDPECKIRRRFHDIGIIPETEIECLNKGPGGDPTAYLIKGAVIALRAEDSQHISVYNI